MRADFLELYDHEYHRVVRFMMRLGASLHEAEDAAQEAFLAAWRRVGRQPQHGETIHDFPVWIRIVARNHYRRPTTAKQQPPLPMAEIPQPRPAADGHDNLTARTLDVLAGLRELDDEAQTVMALHMDGYTSSEIALHLGIIEQKVRDARKRARKQLAVRLGITAPPRRPNS
ncbi:RNA polymerase sigma factor [Nonomuraea sp. NPDC050790]|uniref:RNA polymerase sigma factor n=1 Tax=Nonomuraea sp. NPDC050790 TaxID=3364371 RepID=UPI00378F4EC7